MRLKKGIIPEASSGINMARYYISRALISAAFGLLFALTGMTWWLAAITGTVIFAFFLCAPFSGRYAVHSEMGITALRRDERTQVVTDKAARNAFIVVTPVNRGDACSRCISVVYWEGG